MSLQHYIDAFSTLRMNRSGGAISPDKLCLLLVVMDLVEKEVIVTNRLYLDEPLQDAFTRHFDLMQQTNYQNTPYLPYNHLRTSGFWHHKIRASREEAYKRLQESNSGLKTVTAIEYACVDMATCA